MTATPHGGAVLLVQRARGDDVAVPEVVALTGAAEAALLDRLLLTAKDEKEPDGYLPAVVAETRVHLRHLDAVLDDLLPTLGRTLIGPLAARLVQLGAAGVVLIAGGRLGVLPVHAAQFGVGGATRCLLDELEVTYAPSARLLTEARAALRRLGVPVPLLAGAGNPLPSRPELPFAEAELRVITDLFGGQARSRYGKDATIAGLLADAAGATHVHLACHSMFDAREPLRSRLLLAGGAEPEPLLLGDVIRHRPFAGARLIVASACQTALVDFARLPDEVIGSAAALLRGGTPGMVGTLWPVNDLSTALVMCRFYEFHMGREGQLGSSPMAPAEALRRAQRWLRALTVADVEDYASARPVLARALAERTAGRFEWARRMGPADRPFASPRFWAPFVFVGV